MSNPVIFAGAGPGDPELITLKARNALANADIIIYAGSLVPRALLIWKKESAEAVNSAGMTLDSIVSLLAARYRDEQKIVRLHTGDPSLYGAIREQIQALEDLSIPCRVIPGVTAAFGAAAAMKMEFTLPEITQSLIFTRISGRTPVPELESLESLAAHKTSMAIYLSMDHVDRVEKILSDHYGEDSLAAVAFKVSHPEEKIITTLIKNLSKAVKDEGIDRQAVILVGRAVEACAGNFSAKKSRLYDAAFSHVYRTSGR
ncbi:MAG: precorrin-4 C(11)-methyltransferase [Thermodesulfobacteriota bacterium]|nr:precorrin-4 C(11)-methyltransferase [Thermodesulfobacteriota bacterium]